MNENCVEKSIKEKINKDLYFTNKKVLVQGILDKNAEFK